MARKLFEQMGMEDFEPAIEAVVLDVTDSIDLQKDLTEIDTIEQELDELEAHAEDAEDASEELEEQIEAGTEILATPEEVTVANVTGSLESLRVVSKFLGIKAYSKMSMESISASPVEAYKLSMEEKQNILDKIDARLDKISDDYADNVEELLEYVTEVAPKIEKHLSALAGMITVKEGELKLSAETAEYVGENFGFVIAELGAGKFDSEVVEKYLTAAADVENIKVIDKCLTELKEVSAPVHAMGETDTMEKAEVSDLLEKVKTICEELNVAVVRYDGDVMKYVDVELPTVTEDKYDRKALIDLLDEVEVEVCDKHMDAKDIKVESIEAKDVGEIVEDAKEATKKAEALVEAIKAVMKTIEDAEKEAEDKDGYVLVTNFAEFDVHVLLKDKILNFIDALRNCLTLVNELNDTEEDTKASEEEEEN